MNRYFSLAAVLLAICLFGTSAYAQHQPAQQHPAQDHPAQDHDEAGHHAPSHATHHQDSLHHGANHHARHHHSASHGDVDAGDASSPYAALAGRPIKALGPDELNGLLEGRGMGMALSAELNGYPGPLHALELADALNLSAEQRAETQRIYQTMRETAVHIGHQIVERERLLDAAFANQAIHASDLERLVTEIGLLRARLRTTHLQAHLDLFPVLTEEQRASYAAARGYAEK